MKFIDEPNFEMLLIIPAVLIGSTVIRALFTGDWLAVAIVSIVLGVLYGGAFVYAWNEVRQDEKKPPVTTQEQFKKLMEEKGFHFKEEGGEESGDNQEKEE